MHGGKISGNKSITANNSGGGVYVRNGTEDSTGKDVYTSEYGEVEVELPVKEHEHTLVKTEAQAATCTTTGNNAYTASSVNIDSPTIPSTPTNPTTPSTPTTPSNPSAPSTPSVPAVGSATIAPPV